jgi:hypothetical protein
MKLTRENVKSLYKIYSDYGVKEPNYGETMQELHDIWQLFDRDEIQIEKTITEE